MMLVSNLAHRHHESSSALASHMANADQWWPWRQVSMSVIYKVGNSRACWLIAPQTGSRQLPATSYYISWQFRFWIGYLRADFPERAQCLWDIYPTIGYSAIKRPTKEETKHWSGNKKGGKCVDRGFVAKKFTECGFTCGLVVKLLDLTRMCTFGVPSIL